MDWKSMIEIDLGTVLRFVLTTGLRQILGLPLSLCTSKIKVVDERAKINFNEFFY